MVARDCVLWRADIRRGGVFRAAAASAGRPGVAIGGRESVRSYPKKEVGNSGTFECPIALCRMYPRLGDRESSECGDASIYRRSRRFVLSGISFRKGLGGTYPNRLRQLADFTVRKDDRRKTGYGSGRDEGRRSQRDAGAFGSRFGRSSQRTVRESSRFRRNERWDFRPQAGRRCGQKKREHVFAHARRRTGRVVVASRHDEQMAQVASGLRFVVAVRSVAFRMAFRALFFRSETDAFAMVVMGYDRQDQQ